MPKPMRCYYDDELENVIAAALKDGGGLESIALALGLDWKRIETLARVYRTYRYQAEPQTVEGEVTCLTG